MAAAAAKIDAHIDDCIKYRGSTESRFDKIDSSLEVIDHKFDAVAAARDEQHRQNLGSLRWQRGLLISILLAILAFVGQQTFERVFKEPSASVPATIVSTTKGHR